MERKLLPWLSLGLSFNFGNFPSNEGLEATDNPIIKRMEYGVFVRNSFSGDVLGDGFFALVGFKSASEKWQATQNYTAATDSGLVFAAGGGYQMMFKAISLRLGYQLQFSTLPELAEFQSVTHTRTSPLLAGLGHYGLIQVGFCF